MEKAEQLQVAWLSSAWDQKNPIRNGQESPFAGSRNRSAVAQSAAAALRASVSFMDKHKRL